MADAARRWQQTTAEIETELREWRAAHPEATLTEIETALDARLQAARAELLAKVAVDAPETAERCPDCGGPMQRRGNHTRTLRTTGDQPLPLSRP